MKDPTGPRIEMSEHEKPEGGEPPPPPPPSDGRPSSRRTPSAGGGASSLTGPFDPPPGGSGGAPSPASPGAGGPPTPRASSRRRAPSAGGGGGSSLMGLFDPPPCGGDDGGGGAPPPPASRAGGPPPTTPTRSSSRRTPPAGAAPLMGLFEPPPGTPGSGGSGGGASPRRPTPSPAPSPSPRSVGGGPPPPFGGAGPPPLPLHRGGGPVASRPEQAGRQRTATHSNRSLPHRRSTDEGGGDGGGGGADDSRHQQPPLGSTPQTRNFSKHLKNREDAVGGGGGGGSGSRRMDEGDERAALLAAYASTSPDRVLAPTAGLSTLHDLFRPPSSRRQHSVDVSEDGSGGFGGEGGYYTMADTERAGSLLGKDKAAEEVAREFLVPTKGQEYQREAPKTPPDPQKRRRRPPLWSRLRCWCRENVTRESVSMTVMGSFTFVLYHVVFTLAQASTVTRPSSPSAPSILGPMAKMAALGAIAQDPMYIYLLGSDLPALYPCIDLFLAPFVADIAAAVDETMAEEGITDGGVFLATFTALSGLGLLTAGVLCVLASVFKLANLGAFLPYSVICGFFSAVGVMLWKLAFTVDTGRKVGGVIQDWDWAVVVNCLVHHLPSVAMAVCMAILGPKKPVLTPILVLVTVVLGYLAMLVTGTSLGQAQEEGWFWTKEEFFYERDPADVGFNSWSPPAPFSVIPSFFEGKIHYKSIVAGLPPAFAMAAIYLLRCSLHAAALKKSGSNLLRLKALEPPKLPSKPLTQIRRLVSDDSGCENGGTPDVTDGGKRDKGDVVTVSMLKILFCYGAGLSLGSVVGGFGCLPSIAASSLMFKLGPRGLAPQLGSNVLLFGFYITNFAPVAYIPKPAFSCLLLMAAFDMIQTWFLKSFSKTRNKGEWMVVPFILVLTFVIGMLQSVALGIALSTFIFVGTFYNTGVVKFIASGLTIRSTVERIGRDADWLDMNGDLIQILVLQNYLFFGNASSCQEYISSMFEEPPSDRDAEFELPPLPRHLILDLTIVTGLDASAVDVFADIVSLCGSHQCEVSLAGCSPNLKSILSCGGLEPGTRGLRFFKDMETALGKAEDSLLKKVLRIEEREVEDASARRRARAASPGGDDDGFLCALRRIDEQHGVEFAPELEQLGAYTRPIELQPGQALIEDQVEGIVDDTRRGLFFIEHGLMKVERDPSYTMTRGSNASLRRKVAPNFANQRLFNEGSIGHLKARTATIGREAALLKATAGHNVRTSHNFRLARIGPGWVVGAIEGLTGLRNPGIHIAVTPCRLHHLPYQSLEEVETRNPALALCLFKMMSHLMARRQELTIEQLATLHSIMTSPAPTKPISRVTMGAIRNAMTYQ